VHLDSRQAAVDRQVDAGDVAALVRGEEHGYRRDLFGTSLSAQWDRRSDLLSGFGSALFETRMWCKAVVSHFGLLFAQDIPLALRHSAFAR
jgi:hypothetical protein